ncbi:MAG: hypothetical protein EBY40_13165, partial [Marivivens sp.]|nr:hypothetical protein [Marivivens sp.]NCW70161.1 hypothetical protein [Marivivens sp.]NDH04051.1 hypothetical protein [Marivivens sp.]
RILGFGLLRRVPKGKGRLRRIGQFPRYKLGKPINFTNMAVIARICRKALAQMDTTGAKGGIELHRIVVIDVKLR